ncbi:MAG: SDR family oxidoreductase [Gammaproteobacteria bacterium]|nr:SDR family oxidoreductase [Gammaproteobacteria bacterium]
MQLSGKVALVTGASAPNGIGRAIAHRLADNGATVIVTDIAGEFQMGDECHDRSSLLEALVADLKNRGCSASWLNLDVTNAEEIDHCVATALSKYGQIDILVNNAGSIIGAGNFLSTTPNQWEASFRVNILGPMMLSKAVIPQMRKLGGGRIINIGSTGSLGAEPGFGAYTAMKHGLVGMTKTLAAEFGADGILCNTVCPGYIYTDMHQAANTRLAAESNLSLEEMKKQRYARVAVGDAGTPQDVADAVVYLAGPNSTYVTGINLPVSGGVPFGI